MAQTLCEMVEIAGVAAAPVKEIQYKEREPQYANNEVP